MRHGRRGLSGLGLILKMMSSPHVKTVHVGRNVDLDLNPKRCNLCGRCEKTCNFRAISVDRASRKWSFYKRRCTGCTYCIMGCPNNALKFINLL